MKPRISVSLFALLLLAGCDRSRAEAPAAAAGDSGAYVEEEYVPPVLTPAESIAAVEKIRADDEKAIARIRGRLPDGTMHRPSEPYVETPEKIYQNCLVQAGSVDEPMRTQFLAMCEARRPK